MVEGIGVIVGITSMMELFAIMLFSICLSISTGTITGVGSVTILHIEVLSTITMGVDGPLPDIAAVAVDPIITGPIIILRDVPIKRLTAV